MKPLTKTRFRAIVYFVAVALQSVLVAAVCLYPWPGPDINGFPYPMKFLSWLFVALTMVLQAWFIAYRVQVWYRGLPE